MRLNSKQITACTGGRFLIDPIDASEILTGITWDSRDVHPGDLYVALPGERHDGHEFVEAALKAGARGALVTEAPSKTACALALELGVAVIEVPNTFHAIEDMARKWRDYLTGKVIGVTGSVGKTTTKNFIRDVCSAAFQTVATTGNQNNELGVPNTLLAANPDTQVIIVEMGMRGLGQIKHLCDIVRPDWGVITNIGECHMELLGSKANIARAKSELLDALPDGTSWAILNAEDECTLGIIEDTRLGQRRIGIGLFGGAPEDVDGKSWVWAEDVAIDGEGRAQFTLCSHGFADCDTHEATLFDMDPDTRRAKCHLSLRGKHNVLNACSAAAVGSALGMDINQIAEALSRSVPETGRLEVKVARDGFKVINDAYNANPDSMRAALSMLVSMDVIGRRIAVLGDMGELGSVEVACHKGIGQLAAQLPIDTLICVGELSEHMADAAIEGGMSPSSVIRTSGVAGVLEELEGNLTEDDVVLVKASHFMRLDRVAEGLMG